MKSGTVYIKQNKNSRPVVILNMNVLHVFPNLYDLSKEGNENCDISLLILIEPLFHNFCMLGVSWLSLVHSSISCTRLIMYHIRGDIP